MIINVLDKIDTLLVRIAWDVDPASFGGLKSLGVRSLRLFSIFLWGVRDEELGMRAMSLVYTTILSLAPLLAVGISLLKAFGVHAHLEILLYEVLAPLGDRGVELSMKIIGFVENIRVGVLGAAGLSILLYTLVTNISKIESALNYIWDVQDTRGIAEKFSSYLSVLLIGPVLIFSAIGITGSLLNSSMVQRLVSVQPFGALMYFFGKLIPYAIVCAAFTFIYIALPNTRVRFRPALAGGLFAAVLWESAGWAFAAFIASSAKYSLIYSGFAIGILFIIWLDLSWLILLIGARVAFYCQYPLSFPAAGASHAMNCRVQERFALMTMYLIGSCFHGNCAIPRFDDLLKKVGLPVSHFKGLLAMLEGAGLITSAAGEQGGYLPARALDKITVKEIMDAVRIPGGASEPPREGISSIRPVDEILGRIDKALDRALDQTTLMDLVLAGEGRND